MKKVIDYYNKIEEYLLVGSLMATISIVTLQIFSRYIINHSIPWSEELTRYIFIWQIWLGASYSLGQGRHIKVDVVYFYLSPLLKKVVGLIANLIFLLFCIFLTISGSSLVLKLLNQNSLSPAMEIPIYFVYACLPISNFIMSLRIVKQTIIIFKKPLLDFAGKGGGK